MTIVERYISCLRNEILWLFIVALTSLLTLRVLFYKFGDWQILIDASMGIIEGRPHWRAFQSRLLAPYAVLMLDWLLPSKKAGIVAFTAIALIIHNIMLYSMLRIQKITPYKSTLIVCVWSFMFLSLQDQRYLYSWDMTDVILFTFVSYVILFVRNKTILLFIFPIALLNREGALFLPVGYLICIFMSILFAEKCVRLKIIKENIIGIAVSITLIIGGMVFIKLVRDALFIESSFGGLDKNHVIIGNHFNLIGNIQNILFINFFSASFIHTVLLWSVTIAMIVEFYKTRSIEVRSAIGFYGLIMLNLVIFTLLNETRVMFPLISLIILIFVARSAEKENRLETRY